MEQGTAVWQLSYLSAQLLFGDGVAIGTAKRLLDESEEDRDNDDGLERLAKDDEENGHGEDVVSSHGYGVGRSKLELSSAPGQFESESVFVEYFAASVGKGLSDHVRGGSRAKRTKLESKRQHLQNQATGDGRQTTDRLID